MLSSLSPTRLVVVGDVHGSWDAGRDEQALRYMKPDVVLFTGDFGDEDVDVVNTISQLRPSFNVCAILGNHDCLLSVLYRTPKVRLKFPYRSDGVQKQLQALGDSHVGFRRRDFPPLKLSVVGARPFSKGGMEIYNPELCASLYDVRSIEQSADMITDCAMSAPKEHSLVFLGHTGPAGLGSAANDICGGDYTRGGVGDVGDPDLEEAIKRCRPFYNIPLVVFGHMHKELMFNRGTRKMISHGGGAGDDGTVYVNAAVVPRQSPDEADRNFTVVELEGGKVNKVAEMWIQVYPGGVARLAEETVLYSAQA